MTPPNLQSIITLGTVVVASLIKRAYHAGQLRMRERLAAQIPELSHRIMVIDIETFGAFDAAAETENAVTVNYKPGVSTDFYYPEKRE